MKMKIERDKVVPLIGKPHSVTGKPTRRWNKPLLERLVKITGVARNTLAKNVLELLEALDGVEIEVPDGD